MTRRSSVRAQAQEIYREIAADEADRAAVVKEAPTPNSSPQGGGEHAVPGGGETTDLTERVRALYEGSAVPVREIAQLAGVTERTIYKYAAKHRWTPRYAWAPNRGWRASKKFAPAKGAGGRFIPRAGKGKPYRQGLKATDPQSERRAAAQCRQAEQLARAAQDKAEAERRFEARLRALDAVNRALDELGRYRKARAKERPGQKAPTGDRVERAYLLAVNLAADHLEALQAQQVKEAAAKQI